MNCKTNKHKGLPFSFHIHKFRQKNEFQEEYPLEFQIDRRFLDPTLRNADPLASYDLR